MVHRIKNSETKKLLQLGINIRFWGWVAGLAMVTGLIYAFGACIQTIAGVYLGYKVLRLVLRLFGQILSALFTVVTILILIAAISLIIF